MRDYLVAYVLAALLAVTSGCAIGSSSDDCTYSAYGGRWQRSDPCNGRVGSVFDPADAQVLETATLSQDQADEVSSEGVVEDSGKQESVLAQ